MTVDLDMYELGLISDLIKNKAMRYRSYKQEVEENIKKHKDKEDLALIAMISTGYIKTLDSLSEKFRKLSWKAIEDYRKSYKIFDDHVDKVLNEIGYPWSM